MLRVGDNNKWEAKPIFNKLTFLKEDMHSNDAVWQVSQYKYVQNKRRHKRQGNLSTDWDLALVKHGIDKVLPPWPEEWVGVNWVKKGTIQKEHVWGSEV